MEKALFDEVVEVINDKNPKYWLVPPELYSELDKEFHFDFDPCPYPFVRDGIEADWGNVNWVNPPYRKADAINGHVPTAFVRKAIEQQQQGKTSVIILPIFSTEKLLFEAKAEIRTIDRIDWISAITGKPARRGTNVALYILYGKR